MENKWIAGLAGSALMIAYIVYGLNTFEKANDPAIVMGDFTMVWVKGFLIGFFSGFGLLLILDKYRGGC